MIFEFPPKQADINDSSFLTAGNRIFAKHKTANSSGTRTVFLTEDTLVLILKGSKHLHIENETIAVGTNEIVFLKKGIYAMAEYFEEGLSFEAILLFISPDIVREVISEYNIIIPHSTTETHYLKLNSNPVIESFKEQLLQCFTNQQLHDKGLLLLKQKELLLYVLKTIPVAQSIPFWSSLMNRSTDSIAPVVEKYLFRKLSVEHYAKLCNRSLSSFKRDFMALYHCPPKKWINQKRLEHARMLLNNTDARISQISDECGFEDLSYFTRLFKRTYHVTPTAFRANNATV